MITGKKLSPTPQTGNVADISREVILPEEFRIAAILILLINYKDEYQLPVNPKFLFQLYNIWVRESGTKSEE